MSNEMSNEMSNKMNNEISNEMRMFFKDVVPVHGGGKIIMIKNKNPDGSEGDIHVPLDCDNFEAKIEDIMKKCILQVKSS